MMQNNFFVCVWRIIHYEKSEMALNLWQSCPYVASDLEAQIFKAWRARSSWESCPTFSLSPALSSSLRDRDVARDGHFGPTSAEREDRKSLSGFLSWFSGFSIFSCS